MVDTMPSAGTKMMYTSGCPKNQKMCCHSSGSPPSAGLKKCVPTERSNRSMLLQAITAGMANNTMKDCTNIDHTNIGIRFSDIPGARIFMMVTISSTATTSADSSVNVIICAQK